VSEPIGSSASLITTVFETLGYAYQSYILNTLSNAIAGPVATLVFIGMAMAAAIIFLTTGRGVKPLIWSLAGPCILWAVLFQRTETTGPTWKFGRSDRNQAQVTYEVRKSLEQRAQQPTGPNGQVIAVSSLFANYNRIVSSLTSEIVNVFSRARGKIDARFILRTELAANLRGSQVAEPRLQAFIQQPFLRGCGAMIRAAREVPPGAVRGLGPDRTTSPLGQFESGLDQQVKLRLADAQGATINIREQLEQSRVFLQQLKGTYPQHFNNALSQTPEQFGAYLATNFQPLTELAARTDATSEADVPDVLTCQQVWNLVHLGIIHYASSENAKYQELSRALMGNDSALLKDLTLIKPTDGYLNPDATLGRRAEFLYLFNRVLASYMLRNELSRASPAGFISEYTKKGFEFTSLTAPGENDMSAVERGRNEINEVSERTGLFTILASLPYYQGLLLYILSALFPFFAVMILIPGKIKGFFLWFFLWFWAKSWDIGFAAAMLFDDTLFSIFSAAKASPEEMFKLGLDASVSSVLWSMHELDPAFSLGAYYTLMSAILAAVPVVSSLLILGALKGGANLIADGAANLTGLLKGGADANFSQRFTEDIRKNISLGKMRMAEQLAEATSTNSPGRHDSQYALPTPGLQYQYQAGNFNNQPSAKTIGEYMGKMADSGARAGLTGLNNFDSTVAAQLQPFRDALGESAGNIYKMALRNTQIAANRDKTFIDQEARLLRAGYESDYQKRMGVVPNAPYLTASADRGIGRGMIAKTVGMPAVPEDGDEESYLRAEIDLMSEDTMRELAPNRARAQMIITSEEEMNDGVSLAKFREQRAALEQEYPQQTPEWPLRGRVVVTTELGAGRGHDGIDIVLEGATTAGAAIHPSEDGHIVFRGVIGSYGNTIIIQHGSGLRTLYGHLDTFANNQELKEPEAVSKDSVIGTVGNTGNSHGAHLHFEVITGVNDFFYIDPRPYLEKGERRGSSLEVRRENGHGMENIFKTSTDFFQGWWNKKTLPH